MLLPSEKLTAAEVGQVLFRHFKNPDSGTILQDLLKSSTDIKKGFVQYKKLDPVWEPEEELGGYATWVSDMDLHKC